MTTDEQAYTLHIIKKAITSYLDKITLDSNIQNHLGADCHDAIDLIVILEEHFDIEIPDELLEAYKIYKIPQNKISENSWVISSRSPCGIEYYLDCTIGQLVDHIYEIIEQENLAKPINIST